MEQIEKSVNVKKKEKIWVQLKNKLKEDGVEESEFKHFLVYDDEMKLEDDLKKYFSLWGTYPETPLPEDQFSLKREGQRKYEIFVGGYLNYHDIKFKKYPKGEGYSDEDGPENIKLKKYPDWRVFISDPINKEKYLDNGLDYFEHYIYFKWFPEGKGVPKTRVEIWITQTPDEYNGNPPDPGGPPPPER